VKAGLVRLPEEWRWGSAWWQRVEDGGKEAGGTPVVPVWRDAQRLVTPLQLLRVIQQDPDPRPGPGEASFSHPSRLLREERPQKGLLLFVPDAGELVDLGAAEERRPR
jgi:hypothetical protein